MTILYNTDFHRWEVYRESAVVRNGEKQPCFVSDSEERCAAYCKRVEDAT